MQTHETPHQPDKWQNMLAIVNQYPELIQNRLFKQHKKIFLLRLLTENIFIFLLQYTGLMFSTMTPGLHPVWIASGTACAFIFLRGISITPGIWLGSFVALHATTTMTQTCIASSVFTLQPFALLTISIYYCKNPMPNFYNQRLFRHFMLACALVTCIACSVLFYILPINSLHPFKLWLYWCLANFNGLLIFTCAIISWDMYFSEYTTPSRLLRIKFAALLILIILLCLNPDSHNLILLSCAIAILIIHFSRQYGWLAAIFANTLLATTMSVAAYMTAPAFLSNDNLDHTLVMQTLIAISAMISLSIGVIKNINQHGS